jgi:hypothetical protein
MGPIGVPEIIALIIVVLPLVALIFSRIWIRRKRAAHIAAIRSGDAVANMQFYPEGDQFICTKCMNSSILQKAPSHSFLAFLEIHCPTCSSTIHYPLLSSYRIIYWLILIIFICMLLQKIIALPSLLAIVSVYALCKDASIRKKIKFAITKLNDTHNKIIPPPLDQSRLK